MANIEIHSISTHMPVSNEDAEYTRDQLVRFQKIVDQIRAEVPGSYKAHVLQSAGTLAFNQPTHEIVRAGIMLYGISPLPEFRDLLKPAMTWKTRICLVRDVPKAAQSAMAAPLSRREICALQRCQPAMPTVTRGISPIVARPFWCAESAALFSVGYNGLDGDRCERTR
jgi:hypothetical protein